MRHYLFFLVIPLAVVVGVNGWINPGGLGAHDEVLAVAKKQTKDQLVVGDKLFDQRAWLEARLSESCPDVLVLGSSTVGGMREEWMRDRVLVNAWLGGGPTVEDFEALVSVLRERNCVPKSVIVGADLWWIANGDFEAQRWMAWYDEYAKFHDGELGQRAFGARVTWSRFTELLNFTTTRESFRRVVARARRDAPDPPEATLSSLSPDDFCKTIDHDYYIRSFDGHYTQCPTWRKGPDEVEKVARNYLVDDPHKLASWRVVDTSRLRHFSRVARMMVGPTGRVTFVGMPYHPTTYRALLADPTLSVSIRDLDAKLDELSSEGATYVNLREAAIAGCTNAEFEDSHHAAPPCVKKVVDALFDRGAI
jgi:hypothetical protein